MSDAMKCDHCGTYVDIAGGHRRWGEPDMPEGWVFLTWHVGPRESSQLRSGEFCGQSCAALALVKQEPTAEAS